MIKASMLLTALIAFVSVHTLTLRGGGDIMNEQLILQASDQTDMMSNMIPETDARMLVKYVLYATYSYNCIPCLREKGWDACISDVDASAKGDPHHLTRGAEIVRHFNNYNTSKWEGTEAFLAIHHADKQLILAFAGSSVLSHWVKNFQFRQSHFTPMQGLEGDQDDVRRLIQKSWVHSGIISLTAAVRLEILTAFALYTQQYPDYELVLTGHSLGGAISMLLLADIRIMQLNHLANSRQALFIPASTPVSIYTFGKPRQGNAAFTQLILALEDQPKLGKLQIYRITNSHDLVPILPPQFMGYTHYPRHYWIDLDTSNANSRYGRNTHRCYADDDIKYADAESESIEKTGVCRLNEWDAEGHNSYFLDINRVIGACKKLSGR